MRFPPFQAPVIHTLNIPSVFTDILIFAPQHARHVCPARLVEDQGGNGADAAGADEDDVVFLGFLLIRHFSRDFFEIDVVVLILMAG